jgi:carbamoyl-phosphate synthase large subunit
MPRRPDLKRVLVIGSGPIVIGQACEFDYSGTQACKALRAEGLEVVLVNSNPATVMTDPELADRTYIEPLTPEVVAAIIERAARTLLPTVGGQTALNLAVDLEQRDAQEIQRRADRGIDRAIRLPRTGSSSRMPCGRSASTCPRGLARRCPKRWTGQDARPSAGHSPSFTLGGIGGGIASRRRIPRACRTGLELSPVHGPHRGSRHRLKEFELEVMRDVADNFVVICSIRTRPDGRAPATASRWRRS